MRTKLIFIAVFFIPFLSFSQTKNDTLKEVAKHKFSNKNLVAFEYKDSIFLKYYKKVAFNHKNDSISKETHLKYWKNDIKIFFSKSISKQTKKQLMTFAKEISNAIDSLSIYEVKKVEDSNYIIYYFGDFEYESRMVNYKKSDYYMYWNNNQIYRCTIKLDANKYFSDKLRLVMLKELFFQSIGRFKLIDDFTCESYFANCYSENKHLTDFDLELLKYHYSYGICKGIDLETFEKLHRESQKIEKESGHKVYFSHPDY